MRNEKLLRDAVEDAYVLHLQEGVFYDIDDVLVWLYRNHKNTISEFTFAELEKCIKEVFEDGKGALTC